MGPRLLRARHRWVQLVPMDPMQGTAEPLSQEGGDSGKTYARKGTAIERDDQIRNVREPALKTPKSEKKEGEEMVQALEQISILQPVERP